MIDEPTDRLQELRETFARWSQCGVTDDRETPIDDYGKRVLSMVIRELIAAVDARTAEQVATERADARIAHRVQIKLRDPAKDSIILIDGREPGDVVRVAMMVDSTHEGPAKLTLTRMVGANSHGIVEHRADEYTPSDDLSIELRGVVELVEESARAAPAMGAHELLRVFMVHADPGDPRMIALDHIAKEARRYRTLRSLFDPDVPPLDVNLTRYMLSSICVNALYPSTLDEFADAVHEQRNANRRATP
jgi:hypothetical protein